MEAETVKCPEYSSSLLSRFIGQRVLVGASLGEFQCTLLKADTSMYDGFGNLLLETKQGELLLIRLWVSIKRLRGLG